MKCKKNFVGKALIVGMIGGGVWVYPQSHFDPVDNTGLISPVVIQNATIDGTPLQNEDEVAVFDNDLCVGAAVFQDSLPLSFSAFLELNILGIKKPGAKPNNPMYFKVWQKSTGREMWAAPTFVLGGHFGDLYTIVDPLFASKTSVESPNNIILQDFRLGQNYPNPFNPETTIEYRIPVSSKVKIVIHDTRGREVNTLVDGIMPAGGHTILWDGRGGDGLRLPSGIYLVHMQAGDYSETRKIHLIK
jgi:hypothetical protein